MTLQIELLESSFQAIVPCGEAFVTAYAERRRWLQKQLLSFSIAFLSINIRHVG